MNFEGFNLWFNLRFNQSGIVAFASLGFFANVTVPVAHVTKSTVEYLDISSDGRCHIAKSTKNGSQAIILSVGRNLTLGGVMQLLSPFELSPWSLTVYETLAARSRPVAQLFFHIHLPLSHFGHTNSLIQHHWP